MANNLEIEKLPEFDDHKLVSFVFDEKADLRGYIAIHRGGSKIPALGATRLWRYDSESDALRDALRLSRLMSYKAALAGLKYGGAKGVIIETPAAVRNRDHLFQVYAQKVHSLGGRFVTGTDVGVTDEDVKIMKKITPYVIGSQLDPAYFTAVGVVHSIQACLKRVFGSDTLTGRSFAIQGVGKTGSHLLRLIADQAKTIYVADIDSEKVKKVKWEYPSVKIVPPDRIHEQAVDVFSPSALSGALNSKSVPSLKCKIVAGSANNQLAEDYAGEILNKLGILYAPDYVVNAGGLMSVVDEYENRHSSKRRILKKVAKIKRTLEGIFDQSKRERRATNFIADEIAEKIFNNHS